MIDLRRSFLVACGLTLLVLGLLTACDLVSPSPSPAPSAASSAAPSQAAVASAAPSAAPTIAPSPTPSVPQGGALTIRLAQDIATLTPWDLRSRGEEYAADLMYSGLVRLDPQFRPQPDLASGWDIAPNGGIITFTLRSDLRWHDGEPLTNEDVVWTINTLRTITPTNSLLFDLRTQIGQVRAPLSDTVVISLTQPYAPILADLAVPILPRHRLQNRTPEQISALDFFSEPVGSGPFKFDRRERNQSISFVRNEAFYRGAPNLDQVALVVAPDPAVAADALSDGRLLVSEFPGVTNTITATGSISDGAYPENGWYGVVFNTRTDRLFADQRLRQALSLAVDVEALVRDIAGPNAQPIISTLSRTSWAYPGDLDLPQPDLARANQLLDEAGWARGSDGVRQKDGVTLAARLWVRGDDPRRVAAANRIAEDAAELGMQIEVAPGNFDTVILAKLAPPYDFDLLLGSWVNAPNSGSFPTNRFYDPDDFALFHSSRVWRGEGDLRTGLRNVGGFSNAEYDAAAQAARDSYVPEQRAASIREAQQVLVDQRPYLLLWTDTIPVGISQRLGAAESPIAIDSPRYLWNIEQWYLQPQ